jgi:tetrahydromethanopterin S-methyltransferase subunit G
MEIKRIDILLNKTREELPRVYVTKSELRNDMDRLFKRFDKIEEKLDSMTQKK